MDLNFMGVSALNPRIRTCGRGLVTRLTWPLASYDVSHPGFRSNYVSRESCHSFSILF